MAKILIVDDEPSIRRILREILEFEKYTIEEASDGLECVTRIQREKFDVVILDIKMPRMDGIDVLREIRNDKLLRLIPVVMLTSSKQDPDIQTAYQLGANSYVVKPVDFESFQEAVSQLGLYWMLVNQPIK